MSAAPPNTPTQRKQKEPRERRAVERENLVVVTHEGKIQNIPLKKGEPLVFRCGTCERDRK